jgi:hypothetical protein
MDETYRQRIDFLCNTTAPYSSGAEAVADLTGEDFLEGSDLHGRPDLQTTFDQDRGFYVQPVFLRKNRNTGEIESYLRDEAYPDRRPSLYVVEMGRRYPDGDVDSSTVCYLRDGKKAARYARKLGETA